jgi:hypothetical protein
MIVTQVLRAIVGLFVYAATAIWNREWKAQRFCFIDPC